MSMVFTPQLEVPAMDSVPPMAFMPAWPPLTNPALAPGSLPPKLPVSGFPPWAWLAPAPAMFAPPDPACVARPASLAPLPALASAPPSSPPMLSLPLGHIIPPKLKLNPAARRHKINGRVGRGPTL